MHSHRAAFAETQVGEALKQIEVGWTVEEGCRELGISEAIYFNWTSRKPRHPQSRVAG